MVSIIHIHTVRVIISVFTVDRAAAGAGAAGARLTLG